MESSTLDGGSPEPLDLGSELARLRERLSSLRADADGHDSGRSAETVADPAVAELEAILEQLRVVREELLRNQDALQTAARRETALQRRTDGLFMQAPDAHVVTDASGTIRRANVAAATVLGAESVRRLTGRPLAAYVAATDRQDFRRRLSALDGAAEDFPVRLESGEGRTQSAVLSVVADHDGDGDTVLHWMIRPASSVGADDAMLREVVTTAAGLVGAGGAALVIAGETAPRVAASSAALEGFVAAQAALLEGPAIEAWRAGAQVVEEDLDGNAARRWPQLTAEGLPAGVGAVVSFPLALYDCTNGALEVYLGRPGRPPDPLLAGAAALARTAAAALLMGAEVREGRVVAQQLQYALDSRVVIEQAKGALAARLGVDPDEAFEVLRRQARSRRTKIHDVAAEILRELA